MVHNTSFFGDAIFHIRHARVFLVGSITLGRPATKTLYFSSHPLPRTPCIPPKACPSSVRLRRVKKKKIFSSHPTPPTPCIPPRVCPSSVRLRRRNTLYFSSHPLPLTPCIPPRACPSSARLRRGMEEDNELGRQLLVYRICWLCEVYIHSRKRCWVCSNCGAFMCRQCGVNNRGMLGGGCMNCNSIDSHWMYREASSSDEMI